MLAGSALAPSVGVKRTTGSSTSVNSPFGNRSEAGDRGRRRIVLSDFLAEHVVQLEEVVRVSGRR